MGDTVRLIRGARLITDLESRFDDSEMGSAVRRRTEDRIANKLELLSKTFGLASRRMALVAVIERESDQPDQLPETRVVPVGMPQDVCFSSYFGVGQPIACLSLPHLSYTSFQRVRQVSGPSCARRLEKSERQNLPAPEEGHRRPPVEPGV